MRQVSLTVLDYFYFIWVETMCPSSFRQLPVISICGATGTGKSELATNLASVFNGEVINFDALQLYNGLNIATNKNGTKLTV
ncbi:tRNA dimethylallyltransferase [Schistosoma japonicum]|uniref:tRNA dimethylallyltransferase n=1 Tax=Schistosoma japonicum TaxID=6182 RepID=A0A4Z2D4G6_SCHJA|nr:tRNA dimethylallyltransferase [Schistosoma japonicum]